MSTIIGAAPYRFIADEYKRAAVVTGFEPVDILQATLMLINQIVESRPDVEVQYSRAVSGEGNPKAREVLYRYFEPCGFQLARDCRHTRKRAEAERRVQRPTTPKRCSTLKPGSPGR